MESRSFAELKKRLTGQGRALTKAQEEAKREAVRAEKAESALRSVVSDRDAWKARAIRAEAAVASIR